MKPHPVSAAEWTAYVAALDPERLSLEAAAANTARFVRTLQGEGLSAEEVMHVQRAFARRVAALGRPFPEGLYDYARLARDEG
jgi:hypothetical protein